MPPDDWGAGGFPGWLRPLGGYGGIVAAAVLRYSHPTGFYVGSSGFWASVASGRNLPSLISMANGA